MQVLGFLWAIASAARIASLRRARSLRLIFIENLVSALRTAPPPLESGCGPYFLVKSVLCFRARSDFGVSEGCNRGLRGSAWTGPGGGFRRPANGGRRASGLEQKRPA